MKRHNIWSNKGIALYPPHFSIVGQNRLFNALHKFKQSFSIEDLSGFFVVIGDWGLGKTRLGYELFAETAGQEDEWILNEREYIAPNTNRRILEPQLAEGILPLFIDYKSVIDEELAADTWVSKVTCDALSLLWKRPCEIRVSVELLDDICAALKAKGVDLKRVEDAVEKGVGWDERLDAAMNELKAHGIKHLWVVVDEIETPGDLRKNPEYASGGEIEEEDLAMISQVIKEARYREDHPCVNFLLLCSTGMSDAINIGPNRRRCDLVTLEPNHISDVIALQGYLKESGMETGYPQGTMEGVFIATNRNFGWFNKVMSSIHASWEGYKTQGQGMPTAWRLIEEYARTEARGKEVYNTDILKTIRDIPEEIKGRLAFGQLPVEIGPELDSATAEMLFKAEAPGVGPAFASLVQIHLDESTLANELVKPEYGFKKTDQPGDDYYTPYTELSVSGVLSALRAFSMSVDEDDFVVYEELDQFVEQLATLYPHRHIDESKSIERAAEPLHHIFMQFAIKGRRFAGVSFKLLKKVNVRMGTEGRGISFSRDPQLEHTIEMHVEGCISSTKRRMDAICSGMAKVLDDNIGDPQPVSGLEKVRHVAFESEFTSPRFDGLSVTGNGRMTIAYCDNVPQAIQELGAMLGRGTERAHPILLLFGPDGDMDGFEREAQHKPLLHRCVIPRRLTRFEEEFLIKYSGRGEVFTLASPLSKSTHATLGGLREDLIRLLDEWRKGLEEAGWVLRPLWYKKVSGIDDFYKGYRYLVAKGQGIDAITVEDPQSIFFNDPVGYSNFENACKKNTSPGVTYKEGCLTILDTDPYKPRITSPLVRVFKEMTSQVGEDALTKRFFFAVKDRDVQGKQITQIIEFLRGLGLIYSPSQGQFKAVGKQHLDDMRARAAEWIETTAAELISQIRITFPQQAQGLEKGFKPEAVNFIKKAEAIASDMDFSFVDRDEPDIEAFNALIKKVYEFRQTLLGVCPDEPHQTFACSEQQIGNYQNKYKQLSFWEKLHFLQWVSSEYVKKRSEIVRTIDEQLVDAKGLESINGKPFPIAPVTLPLKAIKTEVETALSGEGATVREFIELPEFPLSISNYLYQDQGDFDKAWRRLNRIADISSKNSPEGIWQKFIQEHKRWESSVELFSQAETAWAELSSFMDDAPEDLLSKVTEIRKEYERLEDQVEGGMCNDIQNQIVSQKGLRLLAKLSGEITAILPEFQGIGRRIRNFHDSLSQDLKKIINDTRLQALNHLLRIEGTQEWHAPEKKGTYHTTKQVFEGFNNKVAEEGRLRLENRKRKTNWERWVEIYTALSEGKYTKKSDDEQYLEELEYMGLVERTVRLK